MHANLDQGARYQELHSAPEDRPRGRPSEDRNVDAEGRAGRICRVRFPVPGIDEIETLRKWSPGRKTHGFARLCHRAGEGRGGSTERQHARCRQLCKLAPSMEFRGGTRFRCSPSLRSMGASAPQVRRKRSD